MPPTIIVDALLGTGSKGELREPIVSAVQAINSLKNKTDAHILALDIPTGLDADTGSFEKTEHGEIVAVVADRTVTVGAQKIGFYQSDAGEVTGEIKIASLGAPLTGIEGIRVHLVESADILPHYPKPKFNASKFDLGRVLTICGSRGMTGAAIMGGGSALRSGCGLVTVAIPGSQQAIVASAMPELMTFPVSETTTGAPRVQALAELQEQIERADVLLIGSGFRPEPETEELMRKILISVEKPIVADAGALIGLKGSMEILRSRTAPTIVTPHVGELAQMIGSDWKQVANDRLNIARHFAEENHVTICMKGAPTYTISPTGDVCINSTGNAGMASAGSGDVLAGMIAGTLAQMPQSPTEAAWIAVYLHGLAGDFAKREMTTIAMTATDIIRHLPEAYRASGLE